MNMDKEEMIKDFKEHDGNGFETIEITTENDGTRYITFGTYFYNPGADEVDEDGNDLDWRVVEERVCIDLPKFIDTVKNNIHLSDLDESNDRPCDYIDDITEDTAIEMFTETLDALPFISKYDIIMDTPDGQYLTQLF